MPVLWTPTNVMRLETSGNVLATTSVTVLEVSRFG
jgi:hypothetical protein